ncbi:MAG: hypothetical protein HYU36_17095 [Planctomycetes bacterium]|nr:hypothetical protein [Planctomycetota bacterium]
MSSKRLTPVTFEEYFEALQSIEEVGEVRYVIGRNFQDLFYSIQVLPKVREGFETFLETGLTPLEPLQKAWARLEPKIGRTLKLRGQPRRPRRAGRPSDLWGNREQKEQRARGPEDKGTEDSSEFRVQGSSDT